MSRLNWSPPHRLNRSSKWKWQCSNACKVCYQQALERMQPNISISCAWWWWEFVPWYVSDKWWCGYKRMLVHFSLLIPPTTTHCRVMEFTQGWFKVLGKPFQGSGLNLAAFMSQSITLFGTQTRNARDAPCHHWTADARVIIQYKRGPYHSAATFEWTRVCHQTRCSGSSATGIPIQSHISVSECLQSVLLTATCVHASVTITPHEYLSKRAGVSVFG